MCRRYPEAHWCRFGDVLASFLILQKVNPVTHSVGNCVKRVVCASRLGVFVLAEVNNFALEQLCSMQYPRAKMFLSQLDLERHLSLIC
jgi:hypothetical protein